MADFSPPAAFRFSISFTDRQDAPFACQEVSGLESELDTVPVDEGSGNRFAHQLPKPKTRPNLKLKRSLSSADKELVVWLKSTLDADFSTSVEPRDMGIALLDETGTAVASWQITNAFPVKWTVGGFDANKNELEIELIELAYLAMKRRF